MYRLICCFICVLAFAVSGCGKQEDPATEAAGSSRVPDDNVFKDQVRALERAEDVQNTLNEAAARQRQVIEDQER